MIRMLIAEPREFDREAGRMLAGVARVHYRAIAQSDMAAALAAYDLVWVRLHLQVRAADIPARPRCRFVVSATTGLDHIDEDALQNAGIRVVSLRGRTPFLRTVTATAELTIALMLALLRNLPVALESVKRGEWDRDRYVGRELQALTAGIVGFGRLGSKVARVLRVMGMTVYAYDPYKTIKLRHVMQVDLSALFRRADVISLHLPFHEENRHLFSYKQFDAMKKGSWFVNTSRGGLVDEEALLCALSSGHLAGAALDVLHGEPDIDAYHSLVRYARENRNLLITPHIGGATTDSMSRCERHLAEVMVGVLVGESSGAELERTRHARISKVRGR